MTDDAQRARRRAHNAHALERCNAMGRTAGSVLWQPLQKRDGKWFMPDGATLPEPPIEWRSEKLETILDEMDAREAVAPAADWGRAYVETLDVEKWKAETEAQFFDGGAVRLTVTPPSPNVRIAAAPIELGDPVIVDDLGQVWPAVAYRPAPPPSTISLEELEKALLEPDDGMHIHITPDGYVVRTAFKQYRRSQIAELRPWVPGEDFGGVSVAQVDAMAGSPKPGDMIARNPKNHADQWLVAEQYFKDNFEPIE